MSRTEQYQSMAESDPESKEANRSKSDDDDEIMVRDEWDVPPADLPQETSSSDTEEDEKAIQALVDKVVAKVRSDFLRDKAERKKKKKIDRQAAKKGN